MVYIVMAYIVMAYNSYGSGLGKREDSFQLVDAVFGLNSPIDPDASCRGVYAHVYGHVYAHVYRYVQGV